MIEKNKALVEQIETSTGDSKQVEKDYTAQLDELELMKPEINTVRDGYCKMAASSDESLKNLGDTAKTK